MEKNKLFKTLELLTGSSFLFTFIGYFCGYVILISFLKSMFGVPFVTGIFFPPTSIIFLGYLLIFSFAISIPIIWNFGFERGVSDLSTALALFFVTGAFQRPFSNMQLLGVLIPALAVKITVIVVLSTIFGIYKAKVEKKLIGNKASSKLDPNFPDSTFLMLIAISLPLLSRIKGIPEKISDIEILTFYANFYTEYFLVLVCFNIATSRFLKYVKKFPKSRIEIVFRYFVIILILVYQFSNIIGTSLANSYEKSGTGIFPSVEIGLKSGVKLEEQCPKGSVKLKLLSKDSNSYYLFSVNPNKFYFVKIDDVDYIKIEKL